MTELELYRKMYATVVHEADQILQDLPKALTNPDCGRDELFKFGERLKQALLEAEELYMSAEDVEDEDDDYEGGMYVYGNDESDSLYRLVLAESMADPAGFFREFAARNDKKTDEKEKGQQDAGDEKVENQEA